MSEEKKETQKRIHVESDVPGSVSSEFYKLIWEFNEKIADASANGIINAMTTINELPTKVILCGVVQLIRKLLVELRISLMWHRHSGTNEAKIGKICKSLECLYDIYFNLDDGKFDADVDAMWNNMATPSTFWKQGRMSLDLLFNAEYLLCNYTHHDMWDIIADHKCGLEQMIDREIYLFQANKRIENKQLIIDYRRALLNLCDNADMMEALRLWRQDVECNKNVEHARQRVAKFEPYEVKDKEIRKEIAVLYERIKQLDPNSELVLWPLDVLLSDLQFVYRIILICNSLVRLRSGHYAVYKRRPENRIHLFPKIK